MKRWLLAALAFSGAFLAALFGLRRPARKSSSPELDALERADRAQAKRKLARIEAERVSATELAERRHRERVARRATVDDARRLIRKARR